MRDKSVKQLYGRDVETDKEGLDESQVDAFVAGLVDERDMLVQRQEHLISLTRLAERTVVEADKLAEDIQTEAEVEAKAKATKILAEAEREAQKIGEQKRAEILAAANSEAEAIKAEARQEVELMMKQHKQRVQEDIKVMVGKLSDQLTSGLQAVMEQDLAVSVVSEPEAESESEGISAEPTVASQLSDDNQPPPSTTITMEEKVMEEEAVEEKGETVVPTPFEEGFEYRRDILEQLRQAWAESDAMPFSEEQSQATPPELSSPLEEAEKVAKAVDDEQVKKNYEGELELIILPPLTPGQLVEIQKYLRDWPGIGITELRPCNGGYSITIVLDKPVQLIDVLKQLPEVENARECTSEDEELGDFTPGEKGLKRVAITVSKKK